MIKFNKALRSSGENPINNKAWHNKSNKTRQQKWNKIAKEEAGFNFKRNIVTYNSNQYISTKNIKRKMT